MRWGTLVADLDENGLVGLWSGEAAPGDFELRVDFGPNSPVGKPINLDALAADVIIPLIRKAGIKWYGWHGFSSRLGDESSPAWSCRQNHPKNLTARQRGGHSELLHQDYGLRSRGSDAAI